MSPTPKPKGPFNLAQADVEVKLNKITFDALMACAPDQVYPPHYKDPDDERNFNPGFMFTFTGFRTGALPGIGGPQGPGYDDEVQVWIEDPRVAQLLMDMGPTQYKFKITIEPVKRNGNEIPKS